MTTEKPAQGTLLIVDDEVDIREILTEILSPYASQILTAGNGKEALQLVKSGKVDAVITDINMPEMTGLQFLAEARALFLQTPVVILTGYGDKAAVLEALRLDATDFLEKPFPNDLTIEAAKKALSYGLALRKVEEEIEEAFKNSSLPADKLAKLKKSKRITLGMKLGFSSYIKKTA